MQRDQLNQHHQNNDTSYRPSVVNAQCIIGSENYPDAKNICSYAIDKYPPAYGGIASCFTFFVKDRILHRFITQEKIL